MKSLYAVAPNTLEICDIEEPKIILQNQLKIKILRTGICGTDIHFLHGKLAVASFPKIFGHEMVGEIIATGDSVIHHKVGDRVVVKVGVSCGQCYACLKGRENACSSLKSRGTSMDGVFCEYIVVFEDEAYTVPTSIQLDDAVLLEPFSIAAQACSKVNNISAKDIALIIGAGPIGLTIIDVLTNIYGITCIACDFFEKKLDRAKAIGAKHLINLSKQNLHQELTKIIADGLVNITIDTACTTKTFEESVHFTSSAGTVVVLGFNSEPSNIAQLEITKKELTIVGSRQQCGQFPKVIDWMAKGLLHPQIIRSHNFSADKILEAISLLEKSEVNVCKVIIDWEVTSGE